jgi:hypothetical protein
MKFARPSWRRCRWSASTICPSSSGSSWTGDDSGRPEFFFRFAQSAKPQNLHNLIA